MRKSRSINQFSTVRVEGAILPVDLLQRISDGDKSLGGLTPVDYHLVGNEKLNEATNRSWNRMLGAWASFKAAAVKLPDTDPKTSLTRERWLLPLFQELGYGRLTTARAVELDGKSFAVSHLWGNTPIHLVGYAIDLDTRTEGVAGAARMTPHGLVQELLNRSDQFLWGFVSNGLRLRILRDNSSLTRQAFVEFDLEAMMEGEVYSDFVLLWLLCHQSRVEAEKPDECWLEKWSKTAHEQGTRALDQLRDGVTAAISAFGTGFISHPANRELRDKLRSGALDKQDFYRELLRLVYRLLFIFVAEDRDLLLAPGTERKIRERYIKYYSTSRIRRMAGKKRGTKHPDLYYSLRLVMQKLGSDEGCPELGLPALGSFLFSPEAIADIEPCEIANADLLNAIRALAYTMDNGALRPVDYKNLGSEELGSVYESLLELHPELNLEAGVFELRTAAGNERKTTGSYYTPASLIQCLLDSALDPVLDAAVKGDGVTGLYGSRRGQASGKQDTGQIIQGPARLEAGNGTGKTVLPADQAVSQRGNIRDYQPDTASFKFDSRQHSGGQRQEFSEGLHTVSEDSTGQRAGAGNLPSPLRGGGTDNAGDTGADSETGRIGGDPPGQADQVPNTLTPYNLKTLEPSTPEERLLALKICDPACGSGHFLIAAAHRIAKRLASVRTGDIEPSPDAVRSALRQVISRCIYGVDINPMAVELCKVALWMESLEPGKPLSFLDHHIQCGNSLIGATPRLLKEGIPDAAFNPVEGDDKAVCSEYKKRNKKEREGQQSLFAHDLQPWEQLGNLSTAMMSIDSDDDGSIAAEHRKQERYERLVASSAYENGKLLADAWCAAFFWKKTREFDYPITEEVYRRIERNPHSVPDWMKKEVRRLAEQYQFFHWHLAFPDVFRVPGKDEEPENEQAGWIGGFDCVLGNPPWERVKLQEEEFFATRDPQIANAPNKAARGKLIKALPETNPGLAAEFQNALRQAENESKLIRESGRFPLTGVGDINTYAIFAELFRTLLSKKGRAGIICPTGIATDKTTKAFFGELTRTQSLAGLYDFENRRRLFPEVVSCYKFCALTMSASPCPSGYFAFFLTDPSQIHDDIRRIVLSAADIALLNPNTRTCPVFRTQVDAELTKAIYRRVPVLVNENTGEDPWGVSFLRMFDMANDSRLFRTEPGPDLLPLYEAKMIWQFDHRFGTFESVTNRSNTQIPTPTPEQHADPCFRVKPWYWVPKDEVNDRLRNWGHEWLIGFRDIARSTDERTAIFSLLPRVGVGHKAPLLFVEADSLAYCGLFANLNCLCFDFVVRQKIGGVSLSFFVIRQLPVLPPHLCNPFAPVFLLPRILELVYTAWDIKAFADDVWKEADDALREAIVQQWEENRAATGGHQWDPPQWADIPDALRALRADGRVDNTEPYNPETLCPLAPFKWDEDRRAVLRAELDAYYAKLYGLNRKQLRYILDPHGLSKKELEDILDPWEDPTCSGPHLLPAEPALDFPGETFRVLKNKEEKQFGEYRTRRLVLEAWERLHAAGLMPEPYDQRKEGSDS